MLDSEALELIGAKHRDRIVAAHASMAEAGTPRRTMARVLSDMLVQSNTAAGLDGAALAGRQMEELGIEVAGDYFKPITERSARNDAIRRAMADRERFDRAVATILDGDEELAAMRLARLGFSESVEQARRVTADYMKGTRQVTGWVRQMDSDPCELCRWWHRDGRIWPESHTMPVHKGCACAQRWTTVPSASIRMVSSEGEQASALRARTGTLDERRTMLRSEYADRQKRGKKKR